MNYPVWDLPFAHGLLIAVVAILHVYVSHFAIGGGLYLVVTEHLARRRGDGALLEVLKSHSRFFLLLTLVFGALTGVGIWFTIGLINPAGTSALIRAFVWAWAIEWTFFVTEIAAAMFYYYGWTRLSPRAHLAVGWIYFVAAWLSMVVINGILTFQLTPGRWLETRDFWDAFLNPTYWPSLAARSAYALAIAGLFALWTATRRSGLDAQRRTWLIRGAGAWAAVGLVGTALGTRWWWAVVPEPVRALAGGDLPFASRMTEAAPLLAGVLALLVVLFPLAMPRRTGRAFAAVALLLGLAVMGVGEWTREGIRKPWVIAQYLYSNGILASEVETLRARASLTESAVWIDPVSAARPVSHGEQLFRVACQNCHARDGYNGLAERIARWDEPYLAAMISRLEHTRRGMPPWVGNEDEASALAAYLMTLDPDRGSPPELADGREVFEVRCAPCHSLEGTNPLLELVGGLSAAELEEFLSDLERDYMPAFTGTDRERAALARFLESAGSAEEAAR